MRNILNYYICVNKTRVAHYGELAPQCVNAYYKYGCALLYKAQEETDPLGAVPKKEGESHQGSAKVGSVKNVLNGESSTASASSDAEQDESLNHEEGAADEGGMSLVMLIDYNHLIQYFHLLANNHEQSSCFLHKCCTFSNMISLLHIMQ